MQSFYSERVGHCFSVRSGFLVCKSFLWGCLILGSGVGCSNTEPPVSTQPFVPEPGRIPSPAAGEPAVAVPDVVVPEPMAALVVSLGETRTVTACERAVLRVERQGESAVTEVQWSVEGLPLVFVQPEVLGQASLRVPVVNLRTELKVSVQVFDEAGNEASDTVVLVIEPPEAGGELADGMAPDCEPFALGVASGDPAPDSVLLWTRVTALPEEVVPLQWRVATDILMREVVAQGEAEAVVSQDHAVTVEATGLAPGQTYYYQFTTPEGDASFVGRTRTAPLGDVDKVTFAVGSCSSIWSGYFNAYAHLAAQEDLDLMIHLGDFVYDFVDAEEEVRLPGGAYPSDPENPVQWRARFVEYLHDPDLRRARAAHPWAVIWDNHDADDSPSEVAEETIRLFRDYVPMRRPDPDNDRIGYRVLRYGSLVDVLIVDALVHRTEGEGPEALDILGQAQWAWLEEELGRSEAAWRVLGSQKLVSTLVIPNLGLGEPSPWDEYPASRRRLHELLGAHDDNILLSGDLHFSMAMDFVLDPAAADSPYDPAVGNGSHGVELLATSITRGNFDETLCSGLCPEPSRRLIRDLGEQLQLTNTHNAYLELIEHGYGVVEITSERTVATLWYTPIRALTRDAFRGGVLTVERGANRWNR